MPVGTPIPSSRVRSRPAAVTSVASSGRVRESPLRIRPLCSNFDVDPVFGVPTIHVDRVMRAALDVTRIGVENDFAEQTVRQGMLRQQRDLG